MKMCKKASRLYIGLVVLLLLGKVFVSPVRAEFENEPAGVRGIMWGALVFTVTDLTLVEQDGPYALYARHGDRMDIGEARVESICYAFYKNRFYSAVIKFKDMPNYQNLKDQLFALYGLGKPESNLWRYRWWWDGTDLDIKLEFDNVMKEGSLCYSFKPIMDQKLADDRVDSIRGMGDL